MTAESDGNIRLASVTLGDFVTPSADVGVTEVLADTADSDITGAAVGTMSAPSAVTDDVTVAEVSAATTQFVVALVSKPLVLSATVSLKADLTLSRLPAEDVSSEVVGNKNLSLFLLLPMLLIDFSLTSFVPRDSLCTQQQQNSAIS